MSIVSKETWDNLIPENEKEKIKEEFKIREKLVTNGAFPETQLIAKGMVDSYQNLFGKANLQPQPLTYEDVAMNLFLDKQFYRFNGDGGVFCDDYRVYSNDDYWNPLNCLSQKQAEKLLAINKLLNVAKLLNKDWKPDWENRGERKFYLSLNDNKINISYVIGDNSSIVYFRTEELALQAFQILGEDTVRLALSSDY